MQRIASVFLVVLVGCAGQAKMASMAMPSATPAMGAPPPPLERSVFARDPNGALSEDALQKILASPIELDLPSRVGVLPIITATDWRGPSPDFEHVPAGVGSLVQRLRKDAAFSLVTEMMPIPSGALGMEALREAAARYRLRYVVLYREVLAKQHHVNPWAIGYATVIGAAFLPGQQQEVYGYIEATMFDVKTGLLMFTTRRGITASQSENEWRTSEKLAILASHTVTKFAPELATDFLVDVRRFASAAIAENTKHSSSEAIVSVPPTNASTVAN
jgi:hypothetical protein